MGQIVGVDLYRLCGDDACTNEKKSGAFNFFYNRTSLYSKRKMERQGLLGTIARKNGTKGIAAAG
jgi:hypothetical protein